MISVKVDAKQAIKDLKTFRSRAVPFAIRNALNRSAFHAREVWQEEIRSSFTNRSPFTARSIRVERATGLNVAAMLAKVGSVAPYMATQEHGGTVRGRSSHKAIPGPVAAGLPPGSDRTKLVRAGNRLSALNVTRPKGKSRAQRNAVAISVAKRKGQKVVLLERPKGGKAIFKLMGGRRRPKVRLLWDFSRGSVRVQPEPTLQRTLKRIPERMTAITRDSFVEQLHRHKILGY